MGRGSSEEHQSRRELLDTYRLHLFKTGSSPSSPAAKSPDEDLNVDRAVGRILLLVVSGENARLKANDATKLIVVFIFCRTSCSRNETGCYEYVVREDAQRIQTWSPSQWDEPRGEGVWIHPIHQNRAISTAAHFLNPGPASVIVRFDKGAPEERAQFF